MLLVEVRQQTVRKSNHPRNSRKCECGLIVPKKTTKTAPFLPLQAATMSEQPQVTSRKRKNSFLDRSSEFKRQKTDADLGTLDVQTEDFEAEKNIENYNYILPHEILLQIFRQFSSSDLGRAAVTCHTWNAACKDDALGWRKVAGKTLKEVLSCYEFRGLKAAGEYTTFEEARKANIPSDLHFEGVLHYLGHDDNKHTHYYMVGIQHRHLKSFFNMRTRSELLKGSLLPAEQRSCSMIGTLIRIGTRWRPERHRTTNTSFGPK